MISNKALLLFIFSLVLLFFPKISWAQSPPQIEAVGNSFFCPTTEQPIVTSFTILNPNNVEIVKLFIQISEGYVSSQDRLKLNGTHPTVTASFNISEGKLTLTSSQTGASALNDLIEAAKDVVFFSSNNVSGIKKFSFTINEKNYLPSTGHYYEFISAPNITWSNAKTEAAALNYYGLQGYLATLTSPEEAQLAGEQATGQGWVGGSDDAVEGTWRWVTGPEAGQSFWFGESGGNNIGADFTFENWADGEPNDWPDAGIPDQENYLHVYDDGRWNDYPNNNSQIQGYIVEYGGMPGDPVVNFGNNETTLTVAEITSTTTNSNCGIGSVTLSATSNSGFVLWFSSLTGGTKLWSGNSYITPIISATKKYYALASADGICETGVRTEVEATIYTVPTITGVTNTTICGAGIGTISAVASSGTINWYDALTGGNLVDTGTSFTSPNISSTTTYYVSATENGCTTTSRTPVVINVQNTPTPTGLNSQTFCDIENATISNLTATGTNILWYANATGGTSLNTSTLLTNNTYYATQTINSCESPVRMPVNVSVYETVVPATSVPIIYECDNANDGDDTNGFSTFDLTTNEIILLNGKSASNFTITYFTDAAYLNQIPSPTSFQNTVVNGQTIYVRIANNTDNSCFTNNSFSIQVNALPVITSSIVFKNCDEDGNPDGYTDFNLTEANSIITNGDNSLTVSYFLTSADANSTGATPINPSPFNNLTAGTVYARVENTNGCFRVATINLQVSTTSFSAGFMETLESCDNDAIIDGLSTFDLTLASTNIIAEFPLGQNLSVHYFRNLSDAQLELNEINPQSNYLSETPFSQILYVRVESDDNGDCFGIGPYLTLTVHPRPEFEVNPEAIVCLNLPPTTLETFNANDTYTYEWTDESNTIISNEPTATVSSGGVYTVVATSGLNCTSFAQTITVSESNVATITLNDITITDDSDNNNITINTQNLGIGDYEFSLDDEFGSYQDEPVFENVAPGIHTIYIQDKNSCGITAIEVSVIGFPKFFTPNNDGFNDYWQIKGVNTTFYPTSLIYIFDRYGKLITKIDPTSNGWDGFYKGIMLPSTDYWFSAQLIDDKGNIREKHGHFSLIRN